MIAPTKFPKEQLPKGIYIFFVGSNFLKKNWIKLEREKKIWNVLNFWAKMIRDKICPNQEL